MKMSRKNRKNSSAARSVEALENRVLLSATVISQVPTQNLVVGQTTPGIALGAYLNDPSITGGTVVEMQTPLGNMYLQLTDAQTPLTVANFVQYINNGEYTPTIIQRSAPGFVLQGGGTKPDGSNNAPVSSLASEAGISNTTGTIAMALSSGPDSGTNQWFINLGDNSSVLDGSGDGGPFTVFGNVIDGGMTIANGIAALPIINGSAENSNWYIGTDDGLPVVNYSGSSAPASVPPANLVTDNIVEIPSAQALPTYSAVSANPALLTASVTNGVLTLTPVSQTASGVTTVTATVTDVAGETASSTFTVNVQGLPVVSVANATGTVGSGNQVVFPVSLSSASASATTFDYSLTPGTAPSGDFQATGGSITIPAGSTQASIPVNILGDQTGGAESFTLTLSNPSSNVLFTNSAATETAIGTIALPSATSVTASSATVDFGGADTLTATVTSTAAGPTPTGSVTFDVAGASIGTANLAGGVAVLSPTFSTAGNEVITAVYSGDSNYAASASTGAAIDVTPPAITPVVGKSTLPASVIGGAPVHGSTTVELTNSTQNLESGSAVVNLYASLDGAIDDSAVLVSTLKHNVHLKAGQSLALHVSTKQFPSTLPDGTYTLLAQTTDPTGNVTDASTGPTVVVAAPFVSLSASGVSLKPAPLKIGKSANLTITLANGGNIASSGSASIEISLLAPPSTTALGLADLTKSVKIKANGSTVLHLHFVVPTTAMAGTYTPSVSVTQDNSTANAQGTAQITLEA